MRDVDRDWMSSDRLLDFLVRMEREHEGFRSLGWVLEDRLQRSVRKRMSAGATHMAGFAQEPLHWVAVFVDVRGARVEYFDSKGDAPSRALRIELERVAESLGFTLFVGSMVHQRGASKCGSYVCYYIQRRLEGIPFEHFERARIPDEDVARRRAEFVSDSRE